MLRGEGSQRERDGETRRGGGEKARTREKNDLNDFPFSIDAAHLDLLTFFFSSVSKN